MKWYTCALPAPRPLLSGAEFSRAMHWVRHAFLNDLQVFSGYLQLGRPGRAAEYLQEVLSRISVDSEWSRIGEPDLEAVLFLIKAEAAGAGLGFTARVTGTPDPAYAMVAAASAGGSQGRGRDAASFALASLAVLRTILRRLAADPAACGSVGSPGLAITIDVTGGRFVLTADLPEPPDGLGLEDEVLPEAGFVGCGAPGIVAEARAQGADGAGAPELSAGGGPDRGVIGATDSGGDRARIGIEVRAVSGPSLRQRGKARAAEVTLVAAW